MEGGPYQEYFYVELPVAVIDSLATYRRFVYVKEEKDGVSTRFPMSFGLEVYQNVLIIGIDVNFFFLNFTISVSGGGTGSARERLLEKLCSL